MFVYNYIEDLEFARVYIWMATAEGAATGGKLPGDFSPHSPHHEGVTDSSPRRRGKCVRYESLQ